MHGEPGIGRLLQTERRLPECSRELQLRVSKPVSPAERPEHQEIDLFHRTQSIREGDRRTGSSSLASLDTEGK